MRIITVGSISEQKDKRKWVNEMAKKGHFHSRKIYVPKKIRETLDLRDGDKLEFEVTGERKAKITVKRSDADQELLDLLERPKPLGIKGKLSRDEIYASR